LIGKTESMIVVCIKENGIGFPHQIESKIKKGKRYLVKSVSKSVFNSNSFWYYQVISEQGKDCWISSEYFEPLSEIREMKLNELGI